MADLPLLRAWVRQARSDLDAAAGPGPGTSECHRRYWLQQSYEKGIKALGLLLWRGREHGDLRRFFLHRHDPLKRLKEEPALPAALKKLLRQVDVELMKVDGWGLLVKVDAVGASTDPATVSYRYPFEDPAGGVVAPCDWSPTDWNAHQGNAAGVSAALDRFLTHIEDRITRERTV